MGYDRKIGAYKTSVAGTSAASENVSAQKKESPVQEKTYQNQAAKRKEQATAKMAEKNERKKHKSIEDVAKPWLGTKYVYGGNSKKGIDCSGYVLQVYQEFYGIKLDHNAATMYKDSRGSSVSRGNLKEGDLVFFGSFWRIDHVGIYLKGERFTHASTSKGVTITPMSDVYWSKKYQGARRFK